VDRKKDREKVIKGNVKCKTQNIECKSDYTHFDILIPRLRDIILNSIFLTDDRQLTTDYFFSGMPFVPQVGLSLPTVAQGHSDGRQAFQVLAKFFVKKYFESAVGFPLLSLTQKRKKEKDSEVDRKKG